MSDACADLNDWLWALADWRLSGVRFQAANVRDWWIADVPLMCLRLGSEDEMEDFIVVSAWWMLSQQVTTLDEAGNVVPDDGEYQRHGAEMVYVFAEFMREKKLLKDGVQVTRTPEFELRFSQLTEMGQRFARASLDKWMQSLGRAGSKKKVDAAGLEQRWAKFVAA